MTKFNIEMNNHHTEKTRYTDAELAEFKELIFKKINIAREELESLSVESRFNNPNGTDDTSALYAKAEESADLLSKEVFMQMAVRQKRFIEQLYAALQRIENKTYGICRVSGLLIPRQRLMAVPHTTMSIEAKAKQH